MSSPCHCGVSSIVMYLAASGFENRMRILGEKRVDAFEYDSNVSTNTTSDLVYVIFSLSPYTNSELKSTLTIELKQYPLRVC